MKRSKKLSKGKRVALTTGGVVLALGGAVAAADAVITWGGEPAESAITSVVSSIDGFNAQLENALSGIKNLNLGFGSTYDSLMAAIGNGTSNGSDLSAKLSKANSDISDTNNSYGNVDESADINTGSVIHSGIGDYNAYAAYVVANTAYSQSDGYSFINMSDIPSSSIMNGSSTLSIMEVYLSSAIDLSVFANDYVGAFGTDNDDLQVNNYTYDKMFDQVEDISTATPNFTSSGSLTGYTGSTFNIEVNGTVYTNEGDKIAGSQLSIQTYSNGSVFTARLYATN